MVYAALVLRRQPHVHSASGSTMQLFAASDLEQPSQTAGGLWWVVCSHCPCGEWPLMGSFERGGGCWGTRAGHTTWQAEAVICVIYSGWGWPAWEGSVGL